MSDRFWTNLLALVAVVAFFALMVFWASRTTGIVEETCGDSGNGTAHCHQPGE